MAAEFLSPAPRDFTNPRDLDPVKMATTIRDGRKDTAMKPFRGILSAAEIEAVARYAYDAFTLCQAEPTAYHTVANGWPDHRERYEVAYPFVLGEIPLEVAEERLDAEQRRGRALYDKACVICHERDRNRAADAGHENHRHAEHGETRVAAGDTVATDAMTIAAAESEKADGADHGESYGYGLGNGPHDTPPAIADLTPFEDRGEHLYLDNCAYCHAADGTGKNWIGGFLDPNPPDLNDPAVTAGYTDESIATAIRDGLANTSMPAFRAVMDDEEVAAIIAYLNRAFLGRTAPRK